MSRLFPGMTCSATIRTREAAPDFPELQGLAVIDHTIGKYHADATSEIRIRLHEVEPERVSRILEGSGIRITRYFVSPYYESAFWDDCPDDCVGGLLVPDGTVATLERGIHWRAVPIDEPLYTSGRPEGDGEHSRQRPHVLQAGGTTIVSNELLETLQRMGAQGETGTLTYRGSNKSAYDTVQPGLKRFIVRPQHDMPTRDLRGFNFLPESIEEDFGICGMLRTWGENRWHEIALARRPMSELRRLRRSVLMHPIFRHAGETHRWFSEFESVLDRLRYRDQF